MLKPAVSKQGNNRANTLIGRIFEIRYMDNNKQQCKRIGIDARFYGPTGKGLGRYTQEIVNRVIKLDQLNKYVIFLSKDNFHEFTYINERVERVMADVRWYSLAEQIKMPWLIWRHKIDLMHFPHFNIPLLCPTKFIVTIHDLILTKFPTIRATTLGPLIYKIKNLSYRFVVWSAVKRAKKIITVSKFTKDDIIQQFNVASKKINVTYEGVADFTIRGGNVDDKKTLLSYNINSNFLLYVGNAYPHKNLEGLVRVFSRIRKKQQNLSLVLVGEEDYFYKRIKNYTRQLNLWRKDELNSPVYFPGYVPDYQLKIFFQNALAYVFPSLYEGFGLPPLEAMARGCPVISSNKASMAEILGQAAFYFNPDDEDEMQKSIEQVIKDKNLRQELIKKGFNQVKKYSWQRCSEETLAIYQQVIF